MHLEALNEEGRSIFSRLEQFPEFYLAGGTALALHLGHRISVDFDLFSDLKIEKTLLAKMKRVYADVPMTISVNNADELTVFMGDTKITFLSYPFPTLLEFEAYEGVRLLTIKEIAVTKAYTIGRRGSYKDYVDLFFVLSERHASLADIIGLAEKKYHGEFNGRLFLEQLIYFEDIEDTQIILLRGSEINKSILETFFSDEIKKMGL